jgi:hypothetical protein
MRYPFFVHRALQARKLRPFEGLILRDYFPTRQRGRTKTRARVFVQIGMGACTGDYIDPKTTMYSADFGTRHYTEAQPPILLRNFKKNVKDIGNSVDIVG